MTTGGVEGTRARAHRRLIRWVLGLNLFFIAGTALFSYQWAHAASLGPAARDFTTYWLVHLHLATENVVSAWYASMLLLAVALAAGLAFAVERKEQQLGYKWLSFGWLLVAAVFTGLSFDEIGSFHERIGTVLPISRLILAVPLLCVAAFMVAFAWMRLRRSPAALAWVIAGIALFLSNPIFKVLKVSLVQRGGDGDLAVQIALLVIEEGVIELGAATAFLAGVLIYVRRVGGDEVQKFRVRRRTRRAVGIAGVVLTVAAAAAHWIAARLPAADSGIPENWFPAAVFFLVARRSAQKRHGAPAAAAAVMLSAYFGTGLYGYSPWLAMIGWPHVAVIATAASACWLWRTV